MTISVSSRSPLVLAAILLAASCAESTDSEEAGGLLEGDVAVTKAAGTMASYPCNGSTTGYDAVAIKSGSTWTVKHGTSTVYTGTDMPSAMNAAMNSLTAGRTSKQSVLIQGSGDYPANIRYTIPSYTVLNVCGTINVTGSGSGDYAPIYARDRSNIEVPNLKITGTPAYGVLFKNVPAVKLGSIDVRLSGAGLGVRIDNNAASTLINDFTINSVYGSGTKDNLVETYGLNNVTINSVTGDSIGNCGLLLNMTTNAHVGTVTCNNCGAGTGYAAFRIANNAGKIGSSWPAGNIHVNKVYARGGGRGVFSVSGSGGLTIDTVDIANTGSESILLQNAYNISIAAVSGTVSGKQIRLSNDTTNTNNGTYAKSHDVTLNHLSLSNGSSILEDWCDSTNRNNHAWNISGGSVSMCHN
jgi:hypothetical protein